MSLSNPSLKITKWAVFVFQRMYPTPIERKAHLALHYTITPHETPSAQVVGPQSNWNPNIILSPQAHLPSFNLLSRIDKQFIPGA